MDLVSKNINCIIRGRLLYLAPITINELSNVYLSWLNNPKLNKFLNISKNPPKNIDELINYINGVRSNALCEVFAVFDLKSKKHIGNIALTHNNTETGVATHGTLIGDKVAKKMGAGAEASILLNEFIFGFNHVNKIQESALSGNVDAMRSLVSTGFKLEGVLREAYKLADSSYQDIHIYGILRHEWGHIRKKLALVLDSYSVETFA